MQDIPKERSKLGLWTKTMFPAIIIPFQAFLQGSVNNLFNGPHMCDARKMKTPQLSFAFIIIYSLVKSMKNC